MALATHRVSLSPRGQRHVEYVVSRPDVAQGEVFVTARDNAVAGEAVAGAPGLLKLSIKIVG